MRAVDFSQFLNAKIAPNGKVVVVRDPKNGAPFPNNVMPSNRIALVSSHYLSNYYPLANAGTANTFTQNYTWPHPNGSDAYEGNWPFGRIDQRLSARSQGFFHWMQNQTATIAPGSVGEPLNATQSVRDRGYGIAGGTALSSSLVNQIAVGHTAVKLAQGESERKVNPLTGDVAVSTIGLIGVNPNAYSTMGFPTVSISGVTGLSMPFGGGHTNFTAGNDSINTFQDSLIWSYGRHSLKFGGQY